MILTRNDEAAGSGDDPVPIDGILISRPITALPPALSDIAPSAGDVAHAFDEEPVDVHQPDGAVRTGRVARQVVVDVHHADRDHARARGRRAERAADDAGAVCTYVAPESWRGEILDALPRRPDRAARLHAEAALGRPVGGVSLADVGRTGDARCGDRVRQTAAGLDVVPVDVAAGPIAVGARQPDLAEPAGGDVGAFRLHGKPAAQIGRAA